MTKHLLDPRRPSENWGPAVEALIDFAKFLGIFLPSKITNRINEDVWIPAFAGTTYFR